MGCVKRVPKEMGGDFRVADLSGVYRRGAELPRILCMIPRGLGCK